MEHKFSAIITSCIIAFMMASCTVSTHTTRSTPPPPPAHYGHPHYGHPHYGHPGPGPKRYPIDQFRKGPAPQHRVKQTPPPPRNNKSFRDAENNHLRNSGTPVPSQKRTNEQQNVKSSSTPQRSTPSSSSTPSNTRSERSQRSSNTGAPSSNSTRRR